MNADEHLRNLHDKACRDGALSAEEQAELTQWYARQDQVESAALTCMRVTQPIAALQAQVEAALAQLHETAQQIQAMATENQSIRQEITALRRR